MFTKLGIDSYHRNSYFFLEIVNLKSLEHLRILRQIDVFDNQSEDLVNEVPVEQFDLETFKKRFETKMEDPLMYDPYEITNSTVDLFPKIEFNFEKYSYFIACYQD